EGDGLICFDPERKRFDRVDAVSSNEVVKALYFDARHREIWATTLSHGVVRISLNNGKVQHVSPVVLDVITGRSVGSAYNITDIVDDGLGNLLLCTSLGLVRLDREQMRLEAIDNEAFFRRSVSQIWEVAYQGDYLWMATSFDLIRLSRSTGRVRHYSFADILGRSAQQHIAHLLVDGVGTLYLGASGAGLFRYDAEQDSFEHIGAEQGLANGFITAMNCTAPTKQKPSGSVYVGHSHGISWLGQTGEVENYNLMNNSPLTAVNENGLYVTRDNHLLVCGPQGLLVIRPDAMKQRTSDYHIYVKDVLVDNRSVMPQDSLRLMEASALYQNHLELPSRHSSVTFEVAHNNFHRLPTSDMEYRLEGYDNDFVKIEHGGPITYQNLPAGNYRLVVRAANMEQSEHRPQTTFALRVKAPIYARVWFLLLLVVVSLAVGLKILQLWLHRQKLEKMLHLEQINAQKLRFFTNLSHEFRTPLTLIMGQVEMLLARQDMKPSIYNKVLGVYRNTQRLKGMVDEIIDIRRLDQSRLRLLVARYDLTAALTVIWHSFQDFAVQHQIELTFEAPSEPVEADFDTRQLERVMNNLLSNAFKYTKSGGSIAIRLTSDGEQACIAVSDTGVGIATEHLDHIFERFWQEERANAAVEQYGSGIGLSLAKNLMEMHDGRIEVKSRRGKG
ncbi:MAG: HAMP domain-containing histidine kinase, partial [Alistipes sp.]|nr:HAMP domain-containing histidine kinase [Alistipes sp.]